jgi:exodeoxyribonuclease VII small subunit
MSAINRSIQEKINELSKMVAWFDSDEFELEAALDKFKEAEKLATEIEKDLTSLKNEIQIVRKKFGSEE